MFATDGLNVPMRACHVIVDEGLANGGIRAVSPVAAVAASPRFAALAIRAFQAAPQASPLPPVPQLASAALIA